MVQKESGDAHTRTWQFNPGDRVLCRNFATGSKWLPGKVLVREGKTMVKIELDDGWTWQRHVDHLLRSQVEIESDMDNQDFTNAVPLDDDPLTAPSSEVPPTGNQDPELPPQQPLPPSTRRSTRVRQPSHCFQWVTEIRGEELWCTVNYLAIDLCNHSFWFPVSSYYACVLESSVCINCMCMLYIESWPFSWASSVHSWSLEVALVPIY